MEQEQHIRRILENAKNSRIAVFTVGTAQPDSLLFRSGFFSAEEIEELRRRSVGSICARFLDAEGRICLPDLNNRTTGISLPDLRHKEQRILIAGGLIKAPAIRVAAIRLRQPLGDRCRHRADVADRKLMHKIIKALTH